MRNEDHLCRPSLRTPTIEVTLVRDIVLGPKVLAELALLRRIAGI